MPNDTLIVGSFKRWLVQFVAVLIGILVVYNIGQRAATPEPVVRIKTDTLTIIRPSVPIIVRNAEPQIIYRYITKRITDTIVKFRPEISIVDSMILTPPFTAILDTIVDRDTVQAAYTFPESFFSISIRQPPDSIKTKIITITKTKQAESAWWEVPAYLLGGVAAGYFIGNSK